jgi:hypothetical protein
MLAEVEDTILIGCFVTSLKEHQITYVARALSFKFPKITVKHTDDHFSISPTWSFFFFLLSSVSKNIFPF